MGHSDSVFIIKEWWINLHANGYTVAPLGTVSFRDVLVQTQAAPVKLLCSLNSSLIPTFGAFVLDWLHCVVCISPEGEVIVSEEAVVAAGEEDDVRSEETHSSTVSLCLSSDIKLCSVGLINRRVRWVTVC